MIETDLPQSYFYFFFTGLSAACGKNLMSIVVSIPSCLYGIAMPSDTSRMSTFSNSYSASFESSSSTKAFHSSRLWLPT